MLKEFKAHVKQENPRSMYGLSNYVEHAMVSWLEKKDGAKDSRTASNHWENNKVWELKRRIKKMIGKEKGLDPNEVGSISIKELQKTIKSIKGIDNRTVRKWTDALRDHQCIKIYPNDEVDIS